MRSLYLKHARLRRAETVSTRALTRIQIPTRHRDFVSAHIAASSDRCLCGNGHVLYHIYYTLYIPVRRLNKHRLIYEYVLPARASLDDVSAHTKRTHKYVCESVYLSAARVCECVCAAASARQAHSSYHHHRRRSRRR